jgi:S1-C subfamily serine protease
VAGALKEGDLIVQIDSYVITKASDITKAIEKKTPGETVSVTVLRSGQRLTYSIVLGS